MGKIKKIEERKYKKLFDSEIRSVLIIGSGPIVIGQAAEFDYSGTQACLSLKEEGIRTVLVNSNPATIMTDLEIADKVYIEPLEVEFIEKIIEKEKVDGILPTMGGQTGLNLAVELHDKGILEKYNVKVLGTPIEAIKNAEDRERFANLMKKIGEKIPESKAVNSIEEGKKFAKEIGYPVIIRPAYTLGGTGGGIANNDEEFEKIAARGLQLSLNKEILVEKSIYGWYEYEYEVMRDNKDNCIIVCNMENIDPVGIHTGESCVVAPAQTLSDKDNQRLRDASIKIIRALDIRGGCNIQFGVNPETMDYVVIEVNPRVSRSSALASKATGYPIARVAAKIAIGKNLDEIQNSITKKTYSIFEPSLDYVVVKIPRWPYDKFKNADKHIGTQMKSTGEVMGIGRTFEEAFNKAIASLDLKTIEFKFNSTDIEGIRKEIIENLKHETSETIINLPKFLKYLDVDEASKYSHINKFFLEKFKNLSKYA